MSKEIESLELGKQIDLKIDPEITKELDNLINLIDDPELFKKFRDRILSILKKSPEYANIVSKEINILSGDLKDKYNLYHKSISDLINDY